MGLLKGRGRRVPARGADMNLRVLAPVGRYVRTHFGLSALEDVTGAAGLTRDELDGAERWASVEQVEALLAAVRALVPDDETFEVACAYELRQALGPLRFMLWATSPIAVHLWAIRHMHLVSRVSRFEVLAQSSNSLEVRYVTSKPESRLMCLSRRAQGAALPTLWGLPPGLLTNGKCIANGDEACEYSWRFYRSRAFLPAAAGGLAGLSAMIGLGALGVPLFGGNALLPVLGVSVGFLVEALRRARANARVGEEIVAGLRKAVTDSAEARQELLDIQDRERHWNRLVEEQLAEKTALVAHIATVAAEAQESEQKVAALRGVSHDMGTSLGVLRMTLDMLRLAEASLGMEGGDLVAEQTRAIERMEQMLESVLATSAAETRGVQLRPNRVEVAPLLDTVRKRLSALAHGRNLSTRVHLEREAPVTIETDRLLLERILDNLLSNAVKYTDVGMVEVTIAGTPGFLTIKVADTGRGFDTADATAILSGRASRDRERPSADGFGVGLSVVVQLLASIGGRLEVMSRVGEGSTFWVHIPETIRPDVESDDSGSPLSEKKLLSRVVTIRRPFMTV